MAYALLLVVATARPVRLSLCWNVKHSEHAVAVATQSASPSAVAEARTNEPSIAASHPSERHGPTAQLGDPDRYQIINEHGRGGLGRVSRAHDRNLGRDVAIKELISRGPVSEVRFLREALITARLEHPGIVPVHEAGRRPDGTPFYAMKLVAGRPLRDLIAERTTVDERIALLHHVIAVADAIAYAHGRNIIHRDLKPANVIVGDFGETIVIDWGLAKDLSATEELAVAEGPLRTNDDDGLTSTGSVLGTPAYMAPEQERGEHVDQRADVFAIGAMLWELCSLHKMPPSDAAHRHRMLRRAGIDNDLVAIIDKAIDANPHRRYRDAGALAADLKAFKSGARITGRSYSLFARMTHWVRRHRLLALSAISVVVLVGILHQLRERATAAEAQLEITEGHPVVWPDGVPAEYQQGAVLKQLKEFVVDRGLATIKSVDCSELPCVEVLQLLDTRPQAVQDLQASLNEMIKRYYDGSVSLIISSSTYTPGGTSVITISVFPNGEAVRNRVSHRVNDAVRDEAQ